MSRSLLSGRSQQRLIELHRAANAAIHELNQHHTLFVGALLGCDGRTQQAMLSEHRQKASAAVESLVRLVAFLDQCRIAPELSEQT